jgi:predicted anti-sigma-YlaC factor YlaD
MNCYEAIDLMDLALESRLPEESRAVFEEHLGACTPCRTYLDQLRITILALERMPRLEVPSERKTDLVTAYRRERRSSET